MQQSYEINTAGEENSLKLLCKTSLKANQLIDIGDVDGYQKIQKAYDGLMKSGNFTAVQNKQERSNTIDSFSALFKICEEEGFIPRYYIDSPNDSVDRVLQDLKEYTTRLVLDETNLDGLVENAQKLIEADKERELAEGEEEKEKTLEEVLFDEEEDYIKNLIEDKDYEEFSEWKEQEASNNDNI